MLMLLLLLQVHDLQERVRHEEQERLDLRRKADDKEERAAKVGIAVDDVYKAQVWSDNQQAHKPLAVSDVADCAVEGP